MADTTTTLRPNGIFSDSVAWVASAGTKDAVLADDADGTYDSNVSTAAGIDFDLTTFTVPALAIRKAIVVRLRAATTTSVAGVYLQSSVRTPSSAGVVAFENTPSLSTTPTTYSANVRAASGDPFTAWTQTDFDGLVIHVFPTFGAATTLRLYEVYVDILYNQAPTATVTAPTGTVATTSRPTVTWTYSDPEGDPQERYRVKVFDAATYGAGGFDPETSTAAVWDSGNVLSSATSRQIGVALDNGTTYKAYVKVADVGSSGRFGGWDDGPSFTITLDQPNVPVIVAPTADPANGWVLMGVRAYENVLTDNQASLETDATGWQAGVNAGIARSTAQAANGAASLAMTATAGGDMAANTGTGLAVVTPDEVWSAVASFRASTTGRTCRVDIRWRDSGSTIISTSTGVAVTDAASGWAESRCVATAPSTAAYAEVIANVLSAGAGEVHYVDEIAVRPSNLNLLTLNQANLETDLTGWEAGTNATLGRSQAAALVYSGLNSLAVTAVAGGTMAARTPTGLSAMPAKASQSYTVLVQCRAVSMSRSVNVLVRFYDSSGVQIGVDADSTSPNITNIVGGWTQLAYTVTSPAGTAFLSLHIQVLAADAGEVHVFDQVSVSTSNSTTWQPGQVGWSRGGLTGKTIELQRSDDGGATWAAVRVSVGTTTAATSAEPFGLNATQYRTTVVDHSAPDSVQVRYRARSVGTFGGNELTGGWSYVMPATLALAGPWLKNPFDPSEDMAVDLQMPLKEARRVAVAVSEPLGAEFPIPRSDGRKGLRGDAEIWTYSQAEHDQLDALVAPGEVRLLQIPGGRPQRYLVPTGDLETSGELIVADDEQVNVESFPWVEVAAP